MTDKLPSGGFLTRIKHFFFAITPALIFFLAIELVLRIFHFQYANTPLEMRAVAMDKTGVVPRVLEFNNQESIRFIKDEHQLWVPTPERSDLKRYEYEKPAGVTRVLTLGDSCTAGCYDTEETYPKWIEKYLKANTKKDIQVLNAGVGSHSSYQGLQRLIYEGLKYHPDVVTVFYGWNDHWISARQDKDVKFPSQFTLFFVNVAERFRTYQVLNYFLTKRKAKDIKLDIKFRVLPDDYRANLQSMIDLAKKNNVKIVLATAPYDLTEFQPQVFFPFNKEKLIPVHQQYNEIVRAVAKKNNVPLLDLAKLIQERQEEIFSKDGIHFNPEGCRIIGEYFAKILVVSGAV